MSVHTGELPDFSFNYSLEGLTKKNQYGSGGGPAKKNYGSGGGISNLPFGSLMPERQYAGTEYRYGFNGMETDNEMNGTGGSVVFKYRIHDPRLGRFLSVDPIAPNYTWNSTYAFAENDVIRCIDLEGTEKSHKNLNKKSCKRTQRPKFKKVRIRGRKGEQVKYEPLVINSVKPKFSRRILIELDPIIVSLDPKVKVVEREIDITFPPPPTKIKDPIIIHPHIKKDDPEIKIPDPVFPGDDPPLINLTMNLDIQFKANKDEYSHMGDVVKTAADLMKIYDNVKDQNGLKDDDFYFIVTGETTMEKSISASKLTILGETTPGTGADLMQARANKIRGTLIGSKRISPDHIKAVPGKGETAIKGSLKIMNKAYIKAKWPAKAKEFGIE